MCVTHFLEKLLLNIQWCYVDFGVPLNETHINKGRLRENREKKFCLLHVNMCDPVISCAFHSLRIESNRNDSNKYCEGERVKTKVKHFFLKPFS